MSSIEYQFVDNELIKYLQCSICESVMNNPTRLHPCGHSFCEGCSKSLRNCSNCKSKIQARQPDLTAINLISDLTVKCTANDCPFRGSYEAFMMNHKNGCSMRRCGGIEAWLSQIKHSLDRNTNSSQQERRSNRKLGTRQVIVQEDEIVMPEAMISAEDLQQRINKPENDQGSCLLTPDVKVSIQNQEQTFIQCIQLDHTKKKQTQTQLKDPRKVQPGTILSHHLKNQSKE